MRRITIAALFASLIFASQANALTADQRLTICTIDGTYSPSCSEPIMDWIDNAGLYDRGVCLRSTMKFGRILRIFREKLDADPISGLLPEGEVFLSILRKEFPKKGGKCPS